MASPVGHTLAALVACAATGVGNRGNRSDATRAGLFILAANAPDLDFIPGLLMGNATLFHHGINHSFGAACLFGLGVWAIGRLRGIAWGSTAAVCFLLFLSHLFIDCITIDCGEPYGIPALWPVSTERYQLPLNLFWNIERHGLFTLPTLLHNLNAVLIETAVIAPIVAGAWLIRRASFPRLRPVPARVPVQTKPAGKPMTSTGFPEC